MRRSMVALLGVAVVCWLAASVAGCKPPPQDSSAEPPPPIGAPAPPEPAVEPKEEPTPAETKAEEGKNPVVEIDTTKGKIVAELYETAAPKTVANFLKLAKAGYYDNMVWHRVEPGFVIQAGQGPEKPTIPDEVNAHKHRPGALAMAKPGPRSDRNRMSEPDSASTQFYITLGDREKTKHLNEEYTVFGQVTKGLEVAGKITTQDKITTIKVVKQADE